MLACIPGGLDNGLLNVLMVYASHSGKPNDFGEDLFVHVTGILHRLSGHFYAVL